MSLADAFTERSTARTGGVCTIAKLLRVLSPEDAETLRAQLALRVDELGHAEIERVLGAYLDEHYDSRVKPSRGIIGRHRLKVCKCHD